VGELAAIIWLFKFIDYTSRQKWLGGTMIRFDNRTSDAGACDLAADIVSGRCGSSASQNAPFLPKDWQFGKIGRCDAKPARPASVVLRMPEHVQQSAELIDPQRIHAAVDFVPRGELSNNVAQRRHACETARSEKIQQSI
jgi:hypothetical protein